MSQASLLDSKAHSKYNQVEKIVEAIHSELNQGALTLNSQAKMMIAGVFLTGVLEQFDAFRQRVSHGFG